MLTPGLLGALAISFPLWDVASRMQLWLPQGSSLQMKLVCLGRVGFQYHLSIKITKEIKNRRRKAKVCVWVTCFLQHFSTQSIFTSWLRRAAAQANERCSLWEEKRPKKAFIIHSKNAEWFKMEKKTLNLSANCSWDLGRRRGTALTGAFGLTQWVWWCHVVAAVVDIPPWLLSHPLSPSKPEQRNESWVVLDFSCCWSREPQRGTKSKSRQPQSHKPGIPHHQGRAARIWLLMKAWGRGDQCVQSPAQTPLCQKYCRLQSAMRAHKSNEEDWTRAVIGWVTSNSSLESQIILCCFILESNYPWCPFLQSEEELPLHKSPLALI